jgi:hypothetical protein
MAEEKKNEVIEEEKVDLQSIIDDGLDKPARRKVSEVIDESLENQPPKKLTELLSEAGIITSEEEARTAVFEEPKKDGEKGTLITSSGEKTEFPLVEKEKEEPEKQEAEAEAKTEEVEEQKEKREVLDEILVRALEKAKEEEEKESVEEMTSSIAGTPVELGMKGVQDEEEGEGVEEPRAGVEVYAKDIPRENFLRKEVLTGNVYETDWVEVPDLDFNSKMLGKRLHEPIEHKLDAPKDKLETKVHLRVFDKISTSLLEEVELEINSIKDQRGVVVKHVGEGKTLVVTAEKGIYWASVVDSKVITRTSDNLDPEKHRVFYKVAISKPIDIQELMSKVVDMRPRGIPLYPAVSAGVGGGGTFTGDASDVDYDNTDSGLTADNVQDAIDEIIEDRILPDQDIIGISISSNAPISTGIKGFKSVQFDCEIKDWAVITNSNTTTPPFSIVFDVLKSTFATYPTSTTIIGNPAERPSATSQYINTMTSLASWTTSLSHKDIIRFDVVSCQRYTFAALFIYIESPAP